VFIQKNDAFNDSKGLFEDWGAIFYFSVNDVYEI